MHQVLLRLVPQGVGGLAILFGFILVYFYNTHQVLIGLPQVGWWLCSFILSVLFLLHFVSF
jgi:hypothetical protein